MSTTPATWVDEVAGEGTDLVLAAISHELAANVENLTLTGAGNPAAPAMRWPTC